MNELVPAHTESGSSSITRRSSTPPPGAPWGAWESYDDLEQAGAVGLLKSADRFDPDRGVTFASYAAPTMKGEIRRHFRGRGWAVHVPRPLKTWHRR